MPLINKRLLQETVAKNRHLISDNLRQGLKELFEETLELINNGKFGKEESEKIAFLIKMFEILGYKHHRNLSFEKSTKYGGSIDGNLKESDERTAVAIEWKGIDTKDLERGGKAGETPVDQLFRYMSETKAEFGLVSNFLEFRLYSWNGRKDNFQKFELSKLVQNKDLLDTFIFLLKPFTTLKGSNPKSELELLLDKNEVEQLKITKEFYNDYKQRRINLFNHLVENNETKNKHLLLEKTQKILDRLIFIMFCEDTQLLFSNILKQTFELGKNSRSRSQTKIWEEFKYLFEDVDKGRYDIHPQINAFNGGLFASDLELNTLTIKNEIWAELIELKEYDFASDLDVNILGHIFEQSINDIEEIKAGLENIATDKKKSKRKKDGIYYTPEYITNYIVSQTLGAWLKENPDKLQEVKVLDPAGGSGAFVNQIHTFLANKTFEKESEFSARDVFTEHKINSVNKDILQNNIFMVDLQPESVEIAKLSLWLKTAKKDQKLDNLDQNIKCGNSLIDDPEIAGDKAFDWQSWEYGGAAMSFPLTFPATFNKPKAAPFDIIVGNPPYGSYLNEKSKEYLHKIYPNVPDYEIYMYFLRKGLDLLNENGILSYIFPNTFLSINNGIQLRKWILDNFDILQITDLSNDKTFEDANVRTCIFTVRKTRTENNITEFWEVIPGEKKFWKKNEFSREFLKENLSNLLSLFNYSQGNQEVVDKMKQGQKVSDICEVSQGLIPYDKYRGHDEFTIKNRIWHADNKKDETYKKELKGKDVEKYSVNWNGEVWISYGKWLGAPRDPKFFLLPRILIREIAESTLYCSYTEEEYYNNGSLINVIHKENDKVVLKFILGVLNTRLIGWYHENTSPKAKKGLFPKILVNDVRNLPIPKATPEEQTQIAELVDKIMDLKKEKQSYLQNTFTLWSSEFGQKVTITKKLENFQDLDFSQFMEEISKQKIQLKHEQKRTVLADFETDKKQVLHLEEKIKQVDQEIENLVRNLYGVD